LKRQTAIVFVGMPGSGKTSAARACESLGLRVYTSGDIIRETTKELRLKPTDKNIVKVARFFHQYHLEWLLSELKKDIKTKKRLFVIEGLRNIEQVNLLKKHFNVVLIGINCSKKRRFERLSRRKRLDDPKVMKDLEKRDKREIRLGLGKLMKRAKYFIDNTSLTKKELDKETRELVRKIFKL